MSPNINTLRPSRSNSITSPSSLRTASSGIGALEALRDQTPSPSRTASTSLAATASISAGLQHENVNMGRRPSSGSVSRNMTSPRTGRRQSTVMMNLQFNDPGLPGPGEMVNENHPSSISQRGSMASSPMSHASDPHRGRHASLGELHQELEQEQEAHVNRLLYQIRQQQMQIDQLQSRGGQSNGSAIDESPGSAPARSSYEFVRTSSSTTSPQIRSSSFTDESAHYQAETQIMVRENQMLRTRIRELERQLHETSSSPGLNHEPILHSHLSQSEPIDVEQSAVHNPVAGFVSNAEKDR